MFCQWVKSIDNYLKTIKDTEPKKRKAADMNARLEIKNAELQVKLSEIQFIKNTIAELQKKSDHSFSLKSQLD